MLVAGSRGVHSLHWRAIASVELGFDDLAHGVAHERSGGCHATHSFPRYRAAQSQGHAGFQICQAVVYQRPICPGGQIDQRPVGPGDEARPFGDQSAELGELRIVH